MKTNLHFCSLNLSSGKPEAQNLELVAGHPGTGNSNACDPPASVPACPTRERLADAFAVVEQILVDRMCQEDAEWGRLTEDRIVWRELIELELQEIDDRIERMASTTGLSPLR